MTKQESNCLKGVAALMVIFAHYANWYGGGVEQGVVLDLFCILLSKLGRYGVSIFFAVSGYGLVCSAMRSLDIRFLKRRFVNVYVPYLLIYGVVLLVSGTKIDLDILFRWILGIDAWFIPVILGFYIIFYLAWKYSNRKIEMITIGIILFSFFLLIVTNDKVGIWYTSNLSFIVGIIMKSYEEKIKEFIKKDCMILPLCFFLFICCGVIYMLVTDIKVIFIIFKILASVLWATFIMLLVMKYGFKRIFLIDEIGKLSLESYLLHLSVIRFIGKYQIQPLAVCVISFMVTLICAKIFSVFYGIICVKLR